LRFERVSDHEIRAHGRMSHQPLAEALGHAIMSLLGHHPDASIH
jgi:hypothetical protein